MRYLLILLYTTLLFITRVTFAQYYDTGQDPASLKWMQIKTGQFTVIYPESYGSGGLNFARSLDDAYAKLISLYPEKKYKIPVVIHSFTTQSNGYVAWAPRRMEFYPTPEQNTIPLSTEKQLAVHELTHVFQMESLSSGFSKAMSLFFGEQFIGITASLIPEWFLEGDAVFAESSLTESGRGRTPSFQKQLKAIAVERGSIYNYDKILNDSYRDFIPDNYQSGYQMVAWSMVKYDHQLWNKVLSYTADQPFTMNPVNISLSRNARLTKKKLFEETFDSLRIIWTKDVSDANSKVYQSLNPPRQGKYINYYSSVLAGTDSIFAIKTSLDAVAEIVLVNPSGKTEKKIHSPGQMHPWLISYGRGKLVWVETEFDPRWENRDYSVIKVMDLRKNTITRLSHKSRYLSASISPDGVTIAATENTISNKNNLVLIDEENGSVLHTIPAPENASLQRPQWSEDGGKITVIFLTDAGEGIMSYTLANQRWQTLIEAGRDDLQSTFLRNDSLFFISSFSGTDNIYLRTPDNKITGLTSSRFGTIDLLIKGDTIIFSDYSSAGNSICFTKLGEVTGNPSVKVTPSSLLINRIRIESKTNENTSKNSYTPEPYRKWQHLLKFHSWMPFYADLEAIKADPTAVRPGVSILTQNDLSSLISSIGYEYSTEKKHVFHSHITWKGWYPVFESQLDYGNNPGITKFGESVGNPSVIQSGLRFTNTVYLPLRFASGRFSEYLRPSITSEYQNNYAYIKESGQYDYGQTVLSGRLYFSNYYRKAYRDIYPRWAQIIDLNYSFAPFDRNIYGTAGTLKTSFYFPGIFHGNGIKIRIEKEKQDPVKYFFGNKVTLPRGYNNLFVKEIDFLSVDYVMPLAYPDLNFWSLLYLKRIRTGLFYDYASGPGNSIFEYTATGISPLYYRSSRESLRSFGFELLADFHILRIPYMISGGVQTAWKSTSEKPTFELLFNIDLYGLTIGRKPM
ncbi:MAG: hypothetical protein EPN88_01850 [Bacteroidetes bacterium]|nr:MAG: hypothetical protein EPN88_01850 [Bacteroidota bacterium]